MSWWKCASCASTAAAPSTATERAPAGIPRDARLLLLKEIPSSAMAPLFFFCSSCTARMAACESCNVLIDADKTVGGVLLCRRCGFLSALDPTLRTLLALPAFDRSFLSRVQFSIAPIATLRERIFQCEARLKQTEACSSASSPPPSGEPARKRKRNLEASSPHPAAPENQVSPPPSFRLVANLSSQSPTQQAPSQQPPKSIAALEAELKALKRQLHAELRQWEQFASETAEPLASHHHHHHHLQQSFSSTHLNILKVMYDKTGDKAQLSTLARQIEQFLLHQSTLLKMKFDLLAAIEACREIEQLHAPVFQQQQQQQSATRPLKVTKLIVNSTKEQLNHRYKAFQTLARPYLALIGAANQHLFALYSAAQSLQNMRQTSETEHEAAIQRELFGPSTNGSSNGSSSNNGSSGVSGASGLSPFLAGDHSRSRRRYSYGAKSAHHHSSSGGNPSSALGDHHHRLGGGFDDVSRVQQTIEFGNRMTEISKKVELWRALSSTIASTCVLSVAELSLANATPLAPCS